MRQENKGQINMLLQYTYLRTRKPKQNHFSRFKNYNKDEHFSLNVKSMSMERGGLVRWPVLT